MMTQAAIERARLEARKFWQKGNATAVMGIASLALDALASASSASFSEKMFGCYWALWAFEKRLDDMVAPHEFQRLGGDPYDSSLELYNADNDLRLGEEAQRHVFDAGFSRCWVNHGDEWETYYWWDKDFRAHEGKRQKATRRAGEVGSPDEIEGVKGKLYRENRRLIERVSALEAELRDGSPRPPLQTIRSESALSAS